MKIKKKPITKDKLGDLKYVKKFALLPNESLLYRIWMERYIEVWSYSYYWRREPNCARSRVLGWNKGFNLSIDEYNNFIKNGVDKKKSAEIIDGERCKISNLIKNKNTKDNTELVNLKDDIEFVKNKIKGEWRL